MEKLHHVIASSDGVLNSYLLHKQPQSADSPSYVIQSTYKTYSELSALQDSSEFEETATDLLKLSELDVANNTVNADVGAQSNGQVLVGVAKVKPRYFEDAVALSANFMDAVNEQGLSVQSDFYVESNNPNTLVFIESYSGGPQVNQYLTSTAYNQFASDFGPMLKTGQLASRDVVIYPVNSNISQFYPEQLAGTKQLTDILKSMPDLMLSLQVDEQFVVPTNQTKTTDVGGYLDVKAKSSSSDHVTYGYLTAEDSTPKILFEQPKAMENNRFLKQINHRMIPFVSGDQLQFFASSQSADDISDNGLVDSSTTLLNPAEAKASKKSVKFDGLTVSLDSPTQGLSEVSSSIQMDTPGVVDLVQIPRRTLSGEFHLLDSDGTHLHDKKVGYGLYELIDQDGSIQDPLTGESVSPNQSKRFGEALASLEDQGSLTSANPTNHKSFSVEGGALYAPYLKINRKFYTPFSKEFSQLGENSFAFQTPDELYITSMDLLMSGQLPVLA
jgi:quinol monooxygenase YgiN